MKERDRMPILEALLFPILEYKLINLLFTFRKMPSLIKEFIILKKFLPN
jgi:hypothetical protein